MGDGGGESAGSAKTSSRLDGRGWTLSRDGDGTGLRDGAEIESEGAGR